MPQTFTVEGVGTLEFPDDSNPEEIQKFLDENYNRTSAAGAFGRSAMSSVIPSAGAAGGAWGGFTLGALAGIESGPGALLTGAAGALVGSIAASKAQKAVSQAVAPETAKRFEQLQQTDVEQHPIASYAGSVAGALPTFEFAPGATIRGLAQIPSIMRGTATAAGKQAAMGAATQLGMGAGLGVVSPMLEGQSPTLRGIGESTLTAGLLGSPRAKALRVGETPEIRPPSSPEVRSYREEVLLQRAADTGNKWEITDEAPPKPEQVAWTLKDGTVKVNRKNLHEQIDQDLVEGKTQEQALESMVNEEQIHGVVRTMPGGDEMAAGFYNNLTALEKWITRRRYHGPNYKGEALSDSQYGHEALRFQLQRAMEMTPGEYLFYTQQEIRHSKMLTAMEDVVRKIRETLGTKASKSNLELLDRAQTNIEAAKAALEQKGETDATEEGIKQEGVQGERAGDDAQRPPAEAGAGSGVPPAAPVEEKAQVPLKRTGTPNKGIEYGPQEYIPGEIVGLPAYVDNRGKIHYGYEHLEALKTAGGEALASKYADWKKRNTPRFGYQTNKRPFVSRYLAADIAEKSGQKLGEWDLDESGKPVPHSHKIAVAPGSPESFFDRAQAHRAKTGQARPGSEEAPPAAPTGEAQPGQAPAGTATTPGAPAPGEPAATSQPNVPVEKAQLTPKAASRLAELQELWRTRLPTREEWKEHDELTKSMVAKTIEEARARRTPPSEVGIGDTPAMARKGPPRIDETPIEDKDVKARIAAVVEMGGDAFTPQHQEAMAANMAEILLRHPPEARPFLLNEFQVKVQRKANREAIRVTKQADDAVKQVKKQLIEQFKAEHPDAQILEEGDIPTPDPATRDFMNFGMLTHLNLNPSPNFYSFWRMLHKQDPSIHLSYVRDAWNENVNDFLNNASNERIMELLKAGGEDLERGKFRGTIADMDAEDILSGFRIKYATPGTKEYEAYKAANQYDDATAQKKIKLEQDAAEARLKRFIQVRRIQPEQALVDRVNQYLSEHPKDKEGKPYTPGPANDARAIKALKLEKAWYASQREQALKFLNEQNRKALAEYDDMLNKMRATSQPDVRREGKLEFRTAQRDVEAGGAYRQAQIIKGRQDAADRRYRAIAFLAEKLIGPSRRPDLDPMRPTLHPNEIVSSFTLDPQMSKNLQFLRMELWRGTQVPNVSVSKLTRGVAVLVNDATGQHDAVSLYLKPGTKEVYINDPRWLPGDRTHDHLPLQSIIASWHIKSMFLLESPVHKFHQRWRTEADYNKEIGDYAKMQEIGSDQIMAEYNKHLEKPEKEKKTKLEKELEEKPVTEEEQTGEKPAEETSEEAAKAEGEPKTWQEMTEEEQKEQKLSEAERAERRAEAEGLRPGEMGYASAFETGVEESKSIAGPGEGVLGLLKTDPSRLSRGPLTSAESEAIATTISQHEKRIQSPFDLLDVLERIQFRRKHISWWTGKRQGLKGTDYAFATGLNKIVKLHYLDIIHTKEVQEALAGFPRIPRNTAYADMTNAERAHVDYREGLKTDALLRALKHVYEIAQNTKRLQGPTERGVPLSTSLFRAQALDVYGDTARRSVERAAISRGVAKERITRRLQQPGILAGHERVERSPIPLEGGVTAGKRFPREPQAPGKLEGQPYIPEDRYIPGPREWGGPVAPHPVIPGIASETGGPVKVPGRGFMSRESRNYYQWLQNRQGLSPAPAMARKGGVGVANRVEEAMRARGVLSTYEVQRKGKTRLEMLDEGKANWKGWHDIKHKMDVAMQGGGISNLSKDIPVARYGAFLLDKRVNELAKTAGMDSAAFKEARALSDDFHRRFHEAFKVEASDAMRALQGEQDPETGLATFVRSFEESVGRKATRDEMLKIEEIVDGVEEFEGDAYAATEYYGETVAKEVEPPKGNVGDTLVGEVDAKIEQVSSAAEDFLDRLNKGTPPGMAAKGKAPEPTPLSDAELSALGNIGMKILNKLSKAHELTDARFEKEMRDWLHSKYGGKYDPYMGKIRMAAEKIREDFLDNFIGTGDETKPLKDYLTRKRPTAEQSKAAIARAVKADPDGKHIRPIEAYHLWNYIRHQYLDKGLKFDEETRFKAASDLGISVGRLYASLASSRTLRKASNEMLQKNRDASRVVGEARNWLKNARYPGWLQVVRRIPRMFFQAKILGHGMVPLITHSGNMMFNPYAWKTYFPAWLEMYKMSVPKWAASKIGARIEGGPRLSGQEYADRMMEELRGTTPEGRERFEAWRKAGLEIDPFRYADDYQIEWLRRHFGGRGFDVLKTSRLARAEQWWNMVPEHMRTGESGEEMRMLIADSVNHATGIVKTPFHESLNWVMFAPKLEASRWAFLFKDTIKAANYLSHYRTASAEQLLWAKSELKQKAAMVAMYYSMLAMNQGFLWMMGDKQKINLTDPSQSDFMWFKVPGAKVGFVNPLIGMVKLFARLLHASQGELKPFERVGGRRELIAKTLTDYGSGKLSPFASFSYDTVAGQDFARRPMPWSSDRISRAQLMRGVRPYGWGEYAERSAAPIPVSEAMQAWREMGMDATTSRKLAAALTVGAVAGTTGVRIQPEKPVH